MIYSRGCLVNITLSDGLRCLDQRRAADFVSLAVNVKCRGSEILQGYGVGSSADLENYRVIFITRRERQIIERQSVLVAEAVDNIFTVTALVNESVGTFAAPKFVIAVAAVNVIS